MLHGAAVSGGGGGGGVAYLWLLLLWVVVVACGGGGGEGRVAGCGCGGCFPRISRGAMYSILCREIIWPAGILGKHVVGLSSGKSRVQLLL